MAPLFAMISTTTALVLGIVVLLLFGNRLPSVMRSLGQGMNEFKTGLENGSRAATETKQVEDSTTKVG